jgi:hypothetical protein
MKLQTSIAHGEHTEQGRAPSAAQPDEEIIETPSGQRYERFRIEWEGINITVRYIRKWLNMDIAHMEFISDGGVPMPVSMSGYRSHFVPDSLIQSEGGPRTYALHLMDVEADFCGWYDNPCAAAQLSLF